MFPSKALSLVVLPQNSNEFSTMLRKASFISSRLAVSTLILESVFFCNRLIPGQLLFQRAGIWAVSEHVETKVLGFILFLIYNIDAYEAKNLFQDSTCWHKSPCLLYRVCLFFARVEQCWVFPNYWRNAPDHKFLSTVLWLCKQPSLERFAERTQVEKGSMDLIRGPIRYHVRSRSMRNWSFTQKKIFFANITLHPKAFVFEHIFPANRV